MGKKKPRTPVPPNTLPLIGEELEFSRFLRVRIGERIGVGGFGAVHFGQGQDGKKYVLKLEHSDSQGMNAEISSLRKLFLQNIDRSVVEAFKRKHKLTHLALPLLIDHKTFQLRGVFLRVMVMEAYQSNIASLQLSPRDYLEVAHQLLFALEYMHDRGFSHCDIKAENICTDGRGHYFLIDFGISDHFKADEHKPFPPVTAPSADGTLEFTSLESHLSVLNSARGDMEILLNNLLFWLSGTLPWHGLLRELTGQNHAAIGDRVFQVKTRYNKATGDAGMSAGDARRGAASFVRDCGLDVESKAYLVDFAASVFSLGYTQRPDYARLRALIQAGMATERGTAATKRKAKGAVDQPASLPAAAPDTAAAATSPAAAKAKAKATSGKGAQSPLAAAQPPKPPAASKHVAGSAPAALRLRSPLPQSKHEAGSAPAALRPRLPLPQFVPPLVPGQPQPERLTAPSEGGEKAKGSLKRKAPASAPNSGSKAIPSAAARVGESHERPEGLDKTVFPPQRSRARAAARAVMVESDEEDEEAEEEGDENSPDETDHVSKRRAAPAAKPDLHPVGPPLLPMLGFVVLSSLALFAS